MRNQFVGYMLKMIILPQLEIRLLFQDD